MVFTLSSGVLTVILGLILAWLLLLTYAVFKSVSHYNNLTKGLSKNKLAEILEHILAEIKKTKANLSDLDKDHHQLTKRARSFVQNVRLLRYNPFKEMGGDQSFIVSFLDDERSGVVVSSLHSRQNTRWFAKSIKKGKGVDHKLSKEEEELVNG